MGVCVEAVSHNPAKLIDKGPLFTEHSNEKMHMVSVNCMNTCTPIH